MKHFKNILVLICAFALCGCPAPAVTSIYNKTENTLYFQPFGSKSITIPPESEVAVKIYDLSDCILYSDSFRYRLSIKEMNGYKAKEFNLIHSENVGVSSAVLIVSHDRLLFLARKLRSTGDIVFPKKQPVNFPVKLAM